MQTGGGPASVAEIKVDTNLADLAPSITANKNPYDNDAQHRNERVSIT